MLRKILITATSVIAVATAAQAADLYKGAAGEGGYKDAPYMGVSWAGLYVGANGGYVWSGKKNSGEGRDLEPKGGFGGGQIGYNFQQGDFVFGIETDFQGAGDDDSKLGNKAELQWFGTVRGRLGYLLDHTGIGIHNTMIYGTGGYAYGDIKNSIPDHSKDKVEFGWTAGGGIEYKINPSWSIKAEYQYISLQIDHKDLPLGFGSGDRAEINTFRVGVNYAVGNVYSPLK